MVFRFVVKERYVDFVSKIHAKKMNMYKIATETKLHYPQVILILKQFESEELIKPIFVHEKKREYQVELTNKGKLFYYLLDSIRELHKGKEPIEVLNQIKRRRLK